MTERPGGLIRVLIVDDDAMVRQGLRWMLDVAPDLSVVADVSDGNQVTPSTPTGLM